jgi:putative oxidoreductase
MLFLFLGIAITTHFKNGFFMNWFGNQAGEGYEYFLLAIGLSVAILINGSGIFSVDGLISKR